MSALTVERDVAIFERDAARATRDEVMAKRATLLSSLEQMVANSRQFLVFMDRDVRGATILLRRVADEE